jgi:hypothetical protein
MFNDIQENKTFVWRSSSNWEKNIKWKENGNGTDCIGLAGNEDK